MDHSADKPASAEQKTRTTRHEGPVRGRPARFLPISGTAEMTLSHLAEAGEEGFPRKPVPGGRQLPVQPKDPSPLQIEVRRDVKEQIEKAKGFLAERGLKAERMPMTVLLQEPVLPEKLLPSQRGALDEVLETVSVWVITTG